MKLTLSTSAFLGIILGMFFVLGTSFAFAQAGDVQGSGTPVLISTAQASLANDVCRGSATMCDYIDTVVTLVNNGVSPRSISYGLIFTNVKDDAVFKTMPIVGYKLYPNEVQTLVGRIGVPQFLIGGTYRVSVVATEVTTGRILGVKETGILSPTGTTEYRVSGCTIGGEALSGAAMAPAEGSSVGAISCAVTEKARLNPNASPQLFVTIQKGGIEVKPSASASSKAILDGKTKTEVMLSKEEVKALTGGNYTLSVYLRDGLEGALLSEPVEAKVFVEGPHASFGMLEIDKAQYTAGETAVVNVMTETTGLGKEVKLFVEMSDETGVCGKAESPLTKGATLDIKTDRDCTLTLLTAKIVTASGETVAVESVDWSEPVRGIPMTEEARGETFFPEILTKSPVTIVTVILVLIFLMLIYWSFVKENIFKRKMNSTPMLLLIGLVSGVMLLGGAPTAEAALDGYYERGFDGYTGGPCAMLDAQWDLLEGSGTITFDKTSYAPGETVTATISETFNMWYAPSLTFPPGSLYTLDWQVSVPGAWPGLTTSITLPPDSGPQTSGPTTYQFAAPMTVGTYSAVGSMNARTNNSWANPTGPFNSLCASWAPVFNGTVGSASFDVVMPVNGCHINYTNNFYPDTQFLWPGETFMATHMQANPAKFTWACVPQGNAFCSPPDHGGVSGSTLITCGNSNPPIANLTVNGSHDVTVNVGDTLNYSWWGSGGTRTAWGSNFNVSPVSCPSGAPAPAPWPWTATDDAGSSNNNVVPPQQAGCVYTITYTVSNGPWSDSDTIYVRINAAANLPPVANAGPDKTITLPTTTSAPTGATASDPEGALASTMWSFVSGPATPSIVSGSTLSPTFNNLTAQGTYTFRLTATDVPGLSASDDMQVTVVAGATTPGQCGTANGKTYPNGSSGYGSDTQCAPGNSTNTAFPTAGNTVTWICNSTNGGAPSVQCSASQAAVGTPACTGTIPPNSSAWDAEESTGLSASTPWVHGDPDGPPKCQYHCDAGYTWNGSSCVPSAYVCTGSIPPNASAWDAEESSGLTFSTPWVHGDPDGAPKCQYHCDAGYTWNGTSCAGGGGGGTPGLPVVNYVCNAAGTSVTFNWTRPAGAVEFFYRFDTDTSIPHIDAVDKYVPLTWTKNGITPNTYYYFWIHAGNGGPNWGTDINMTPAYTNPVPFMCPGGAGAPAPTCSLTFNGSASDQFNVDPMQVRTWAWNSSNGVNPYLLTSNVTSCENPAYNTGGTINWTPWIAPFGNGSIAGGSNTDTPGVNRYGCVGTNVYRVTNSDGVSVTCDITVGFRASAGVNLTSHTLLLNSGSLVDGQTVNFRSTVQNNSSLATPSSFSDNFTYRYGTSGAWNVMNTIAEPVLAAGASRVDTSSNFTLTQTGTLQIQHCVDTVMASPIGEISETNETDNCQVMSFTVGVAGNQPPVVNAGPDKAIVLPTTNSAPTGASASDPDGSIALRQWTFVSGPSTPTITNGTTLTPTFTNLNAVGTYVFRLTATDNQGATGWDQMQVVVTDPAGPPPCILPMPSWTGVVTAAFAGGVWGTGPFTVDSIPSHIARYLGATPGTTRTVTFSNPQNYPSFSGGTNNGYTTSAYLGTWCGMTAALVGGSGNQPPVVNAGPDKAITLPTSNSAPTGVSATDPDGSIADIQWTLVSGPGTPTITNQNTLNPSFSDMTFAGTYVFRLSVTDNQGARASDDMQVVVSNGGGGCVLPFPSWTGVVSNASSGGVWGVSSFRNDSDPSHIARFLGGIPGTTRTVTFSNPSFRVFFNGGTNNGYTTGMSFFGCGMDATLSASGGNQSPVVNAGPDKTITLPTTNSAPTGASASDPDGSITSRQWTFISGPSTPNISNGTTLTPSFTNLTTVGTYTFRLTATDNQGATGADEMDVEVEPVGGGGGNCPATVINNCVLQQTPYGGNSGACAVNYTGNCNYTCQNTGSWSRNNNTCTLSPSGSINANPGTVNNGNTSVITWSSNNASSCTVTSNRNSDNWSGLNNAAGRTTSPLTSDTTYILTCDGIPVDDVTITVNFGPTLTATPQVVKRGTATSLDWDTNNGNESLCTLIGGSVNLNPIPLSGSSETGSVSTVVTTRTTYTLTCPTGTDSTTVDIIPNEFEE